LQAYLFFIVKDHKGGGK